MKPWVTVVEKRVAATKKIEISACGIVFIRCSPDGAGDGNSEFRIRNSEVPRRGSVGAPTRAGEGRPTRYLVATSESRTRRFQCSGARSISSMNRQAIGDGLRTSCSHDRMVIDEVPMKRAKSG